MEKLVWKELLKEISQFTNLGTYFTSLFFKASNQKNQCGWTPAGIKVELKRNFFKEITFLLKAKKQITKLSLLWDLVL